jgi:hypothetical protein
MTNAIARKNIDIVMQRDPRENEGDLTSVCHYSGGMYHWLHSAFLLYDHGTAGTAGGRFGTPGSGTR